MAAPARWPGGRSKTTGKHGSYGTPIVARLADRPQVILSGMGEVAGYDPVNGKQLWSCAGPAEVTGCTVAVSDRLVFASGGYPEKEILAIRADGEGDVSKSHVAWRSNEGVTYVPSPLYHDGKLYVVNDTGIATCFEAATGKQVWQGRLSGSFSSSPVLVGDLLYAANETGKTFVCKTGPKFEIVAANALDEGVMATPTVRGGLIYPAHGGPSLLPGSSQMSRGHWNCWRQRPLTSLGPLSASVPAVSVIQRGKLVIVDWHPPHVRD